MLEKWVTLLRWYVRELWSQFLDADCLARAGALTYTTLFAVVPMMTVAYAMFSVLPEFADVGERVQGFLFKYLVPSSSELLQEKLVEFSERARQLTAIGFVFLFVTAFLMLVNVEKTFNAIWHVSEPRRGLQRFLLYWGVLSLGPPLIAGGLIISLYLISLPLVSGLDSLGLRSVILGYAPYLLTTAGFTVLYYAVPNCHVPFRNALVGGFLTMSLFELAKYVFTLVVRNSSIEPIYGTFAAVPLFLVWLYLVWVLVLSGAILVRTLSLKPEIEEERPEPPLVKCARILELLYAAQLDGVAVTDVEIAAAVPMTRQERDRVFEVLHGFRLLSQSDDDGWILARNLKALTLWDLYQKLPEEVDLERLSRVEGMKNVIEPLKALVQFGSNEMAVSLDRVLGGTTA